MNGLGPSQFHGVQMNDILIVQELLSRKIFHYFIDIVEGNIFGDLSRRTVQKRKENTVRPLTYNNDICYVSNINAVFQSFRCHQF